MLASAKLKLHWDQVLHEVLAQYNRTIHDDTGIPPVSFFVSHKRLLNTAMTKNFWREAPKNFKTFQESDLVMSKIPFHPARGRVGRVTDGGVRGLWFKSLG